MLRIFRSWIDRYFSDEEAVLLVVLIVASLAVLLTMGMVLAPMIASIIIAFLMQGVVVRLRGWGLPTGLRLLWRFCCWLPCWSPCCLFCCRLFGSSRRALLQKCRA